MTKVIKLACPQGEYAKKKIQFIEGIPDSGICDISPETYDYIELICRNFKDSGLDLMFCYFEEGRSGKYSALYLGHFNDGVV